MKNKITLVVIVLVSLLVGGAAGASLFNQVNKNELPAPQIASGIRGSTFGIDKNIDETTIDQYLNRSDSIYRDVRMLIDDGNYENIGGDSYLSGFIKGFEVIPYPFLEPVSDLPPEVGAGYGGPTLFSKDKSGNYQANYEESMFIMESIFPKDKNIFLICGGGGYAGATKQLLVTLGWDENRIYNVGGYWYYQGNNSVVTKQTKNGEDYYNFSVVPYYHIDFETLHTFNHD